MVAAVNDVALGIYLVRTGNASLGHKLLPGDRLALLGVVGIQVGERDAGHVEPLAVAVEAHRMAVLIQIPRRRGNLGAAGSSAHELILARSVELIGLGYVDGTVGAIVGNLVLPCCVKLTLSAVGHVGLRGLVEHVGSHAVIEAGTVIVVRAAALAHQVGGNVEVLQTEGFFGDAALRVVANVLVEDARQRHRIKVGSTTIVRGVSAISTVLETHLVYGAGRREVVVAHAIAVIVDVLHIGVVGLKRRRVAQVVVSGNVAERVVVVEPLVAVFLGGDLVGVVRLRTVVFGLNAGIEAVGNLVARHPSRIGCRLAGHPLAVGAIRGVEFLARSIGDVVARGVPRRLVR